MTDILRFFGKAVLAGLHRQWEGTGNMIRIIQEAATAPNTEEGD